MRPSDGQYYPVVAARSPPPVDCNLLLIPLGRSRIVALLRGRSHERLPRRSKPGGYPDQRTCTDAPAWSKGGSLYNSFFHILCINNSKGVVCHSGSESCHQLAEIARLLGPLTPRPFSTSPFNAYRASSASMTYNRYGNGKGRILFRASGLRSVSKAAQKRPPLHFSTITSQLRSPLALSDL